MATRYHDLVEKQRSFYKSGATRCVEQRRKWLETIKTMLVENKKELDDSIYADLKRVNTMCREVEGTIRDLDLILDNFVEWGKPHTVPAHYDQENDVVMIVKEPLGVVLGIATWNFPLITSFFFAAAIAAGNTAILKPSELTPTFSALIAKLVKKYFDERILAVVEGGVDEVTDLLKERFDYIMYTGNPRVGRIIMAAAAINLTPVTLELGGKNPILVEPDADIDAAATGIFKAKTRNCGQLCICTDYVLTTAEVKPKLVEALSKKFDSLMPIKENEKYSRIVNQRHFDRLMDLLERSKGTILYKTAVEADRNDKFIPPTVIDVEADDELMKEEIFGPLLPIVTVKSFEEAIDFVNSREKPLAAYLYTNDTSKVETFLKSTSSGGVTVNDTLIHCHHPGLPFGGVGNSGLGRINGKFTFDSMVHEKAVVVRTGIGKTLDHKI